MSFLQIVNVLLDHRKFSNMLFDFQAAVPELVVSKMLVKAQAGADDQGRQEANHATSHVNDTGTRMVPIAGFGKPAVAPHPARS